MSYLKLRELVASYRSYGSELSFRARYATCVARTILSVSDCVGRLNRKSRGLEDADWLLRARAPPSDYCGEHQLLLAGSFIMSGIITVFLRGGTWHAYHCGQTVGWIKMPLGKEVGLGPGHIVLDGDPVGTQPATAAPPHFSVHVYCGQTVAHLSNC